jgi:hypothetical protein
MITGLPFPFALYTVRVRLLSGKADRKEARLWSEVATVSERTQPSRPFRFVIGLILRVLKMGLLI